MFPSVKCSVTVEKLCWHRNQTSDFYPHSSSTPTIIQRKINYKEVEEFRSVFSSIAQLRPTLCNPMNCSLSITNSRSPPKPMSIESAMPSNHLIFCRPLLLLPSIFPSIRVFSDESALHIRWPKYWSFNFNISPSNEHPGLISFRMD